ncbi:helix-turn-helix domain-containing protein [Geosporobacter ferrireducens]|uniref:HTH araC/xylS-type domain-containing protein n=1 Tax=Geosporobacter ferrireducens TaxID=1424294 RepID=A0A1D8GM80_9FIRM|nr:helix-turn-helix domain-containing protein [Geosporobacter ferrireducens]AOT72025.1 hypothetical protein Gferi_22295 [Geosporobacter ferrireducens]
MRDKFKKRFGKKFFRIFLMITALAIIPMVMANYFIYYRYTQINDKQNAEVIENMINQSDYINNLILQDTKEIMKQLSTNKLVVEWIINPDTKNENHIFDIINELKAIAESRGHITSIYIYNTHINKVITSVGGVYNLEDFYDKSWLDKSQGILLGTRILETRFVRDGYNNQANSITLMNNLLYGSWSNLGRLIVNIDANKLYEKVSKLHNDKTGRLYVIDNKGTIILGNRNDLYKPIGNETIIETILKGGKGTLTESYKGGNQKYIYKKSIYNNWHYVWVIPLKSFMQSNFVLGDNIIIVTLLGISISFIIAIFITNHIYKPIKELINMVLQRTSGDRDRQYEKDDYKLLNEIYDALMEENSYITDTLERQKPLIKESLFLSLLNGKINTEKEIKENLQLIGLDFYKEAYGVIILSVLEKKDDFDKLQEHDKNIIKDKFIKCNEKILYNLGYQNVCIEVAEDTYTLIISIEHLVAETKFNENIINICEYIIKYGLTEFEFKIAIGVGNIYKNIIDVKESYKDAKKSLKRKVYEKDREHKVENKESLYLFELSIIDKIIEEVNNNEQNKVNTLLQVLEANFNKDEYEDEEVAPMFIKLFTELEQTAIESEMDPAQVVEGGFESVDVNRLLKKEGKRYLVQLVTKICNNIIVYNLSGVAEKQQKRMEQMLKYIEENFHKDISLNDLADYMDLSFAYVSRIFKEYTKVGYVDYINKLRIDKARELLDNTELTVKEIGFRVGYNNMQSFFRTFKKFNNLTPTQYRDKNA